MHGPYAFSRAGRSVAHCPRPGLKTEEGKLNQKTDETAVVDHEVRAGADQDEALRLWLRMLSCTSLIERQVRSNLRREFDITLPRFDLMAHLERSPQGLRMGDLSRRMMVTSGNVTGITDQLESEGLVIREFSPRDRRAFIVRLTPNGRRVFRRMAQAYEQWIVGMFDTLPVSDRTQLLKLLGTLKQDLHETVPD